jgi:hypothetical protein
MCSSDCRRQRRRGMLVAKKYAETAKQQAGPEADAGETAPPISTTQTTTTTPACTAGRSSPAPATEQCSSDGRRGHTGPAPKCMNRNPDRCCTLRRVEQAEVWQYGSSRHESRTPGRLHKPPVRIQGSSQIGPLELLLPLIATQRFIYTRAHNL